MWMNRWDIAESVERYPANSVKGRAARFLSSFADQVNQNSDGWAYWQRPIKAADKLQKLIQSPVLVTDSDFRKAITPIKAFYTRHGYKAGMSFPDVA